MNGVTFRYFAVKDYRTLIAEHDFALERVYGRSRREHVLLRPEAILSGPMWLGF
jgi:hypothetical protein